MRFLKIEPIIFLITLVQYSYGWVAQFAAGTFIASAVYQYWPCKLSWSECCSKQWIKTNNMTELDKQLNHRLYGQHLVLKTVVPAIKKHLSNEHPQKALALSFHGWTGGGKNYVSRMIAESLFKKGTASKFYHLFVSTLHFPHKESSSLYKDQIQQWIKGNVSQCPHQLFIFDEMDKMPAGLIDAIQPFIDFHDHVDNVNYRHSVFLFLSNTGGDLITRQMIKLWRSGQSREEVALRDMELLLQNLAFNNKDETGLWHSSLLEKNLINALIPFLPLERIHVKQCAKDYLQSKFQFKLANDDKALEKIANEITYQPKNSELYSTSGCKRVAQYCDLLIYSEGDNL